MAPKRKHAGGGQVQPARQRAQHAVTATKPTDTAATIARDPLGFLLGPEQAWLIATDAHRAALGALNAR